MRNNWDEEHIRELVEQISDKHFEEAALVRAGIRQAPETEKRGGGRFLGYGLAAACLLVLIGAATVNIHKNQEFQPAGSISASDNDAEEPETTINVSGNDEEQEYMIPLFPGDGICPDWMFEYGLTGKYHEGIGRKVYENPYYCPFVTTRELKLYTENYFTTGNGQDSIQVPADTVLTFVATDRTEWIYVEDDKGQYSGWLHFLIKSDHAYLVENEDQLYSLGDCFYSHNEVDNLIFEGELGEPGIFEEELSEQPFALISFNSRSELEDWLEEHDEELPENMKTDCRKLIDGWSMYVECFVGDYPQIFIFVYQDAKRTDNVKCDYAHSKIDWELGRMVLYSFQGGDIEKVPSTYYCIGTDHYADKTEFRDFDSLKRIYVQVGSLD